MVGVVDHHLFVGAVTAVIIEAVKVVDLDSHFSVEIIRIRFFAEADEEVNCRLIVEIVGLHLSVEVIKAVEVGYHSFVKVIGQSPFVKAEAAVAAVVVVEATVTFIARVRVIVGVDYLLFVETIDHLDFIVIVVAGVDFRPFVKVISLRSSIVVTEVVELKYHAVGLHFLLEAFAVVDYHESYSDPEEADCFRSFGARCFEMVEKVLVVSDFVFNHSLEEVVFSILLPHQNHHCRRCHYHHFRHCLHRHYLKSS